MAGCDFAKQRTGGAVKPLYKADAHEMIAMQKNSICISIFDVIDNESPCYERTMIELIFSPRH